MVKFIPKVTFVMPSIRNAFLKEAIESIQKQSLTDWELLFFDNAPEPRQFDFLIDNRIKIIRSCVGKRIEDCYNEALKIAQSDIILMAHDDDINFPERAELSYNILNNNDYDLVYSSHLVINESGKLLGFHSSEKFDYKTHKEIQNMVSFPTIGFKKNKVPPFRYIDMCHDWAFIYDCANAGLRFENINVPLIKYRVWANSDSQNIIKQNKVEQINIQLRQIYNDENIRKHKKEYSPYEAKKKFYNTKNSYVKITKRKLTLIDYIKAIVDNHNYNVLDIGCGDGFITACLAHYCNITGLDLSLSTVFRSNKKIKFYEYNIEKEDLNLESKCDIVLFLDVLEHINQENEIEVLNRIFKLAEKKVIIDVPSLIAKDELKQIIDRKIDVKVIYEVASKNGFEIEIEKEFSISNTEKYKFMVFKK